ncbi:MAG: hypothetical protein IJE43_02075 [Alphaproteobacteria bacterium]|nr:hypothetical protein [Alphaproteobacteria bacterium]
MFEMSILGLQVSINLLPGIYLMGNTSAVGKSRLGLLLEKAFLNGSSTYYYTYSDFVKGVKLKDILSKQKYDVVLIDRLDLYIQQYDVFTEIVNFTEHTIFLLDLKNIIEDVRGLKYCTVCMGEKDIKVI